MTLLLDAEARLFVFPDETRAEPDRARPRVVTPTAPSGRALPPAPAASPEPARWAGAGEQRRTLDDLLSASWDGLSAESAAAACPVCDGELVRRWSAGAGVVGGRCRDCGSELS